MHAKKAIVEIASSADAAVWRSACYHFSAVEMAKGTIGMEHTKPVRSTGADGDGHSEPPLTGRNFDTVMSAIEELERQVIRNRQDIDIQFQRLADLQAVIDRIQIAAQRARGDGRG